MEALAQRAQSGEDTLHVHHNGLAGAGEHHVLLVQEVTGHGDAVTHGHLVGGAAHAGNGDALGAHALGVGDHFGIIGVMDNHFGQGGIMTVNHNVHIVLLHNADVGGGIHRLGGAEHHVGELGAHHGAAPAVGQTGTEGLTDQGFRQRGTAHMGHVHGLGNLPVNGPGLDLRGLPQILGVLRGPLQEPLGTEGLAVLQQADLRHFMGQVVDVLALGLHAPFLGDADQLLRILHLVAAAFLGLMQGVHNLTAVVRVGSGAAGGEPQIVTAYDAVHVAATDAPGRLLGNAAGAHGADTAAGAGFAETTVGTLVLGPLLPCVSANFLRGFQQRIGGSFHLFDGGCKCPILQNDFLLKLIVLNGYKVYFIMNP